MVQLRLLEETASASALVQANRAMARQSGLSSEASSAGATFASVVEVRLCKCMSACRRHCGHSPTCKTSAILLERDGTR